MARKVIEHQGDFVRWTEEPELQLPPLVGCCEVTIRRGEFAVVMRTRMRISEVMEVCRARFGGVAP